MQATELRQLLLGPSIYAHCSASGTVSNSDLESRLETLKDLGCSENMSVEDLVAMCSLNTRNQPNANDLSIQDKIRPHVPCLQKSTRIKLRQLLLGPTIYRQCNFSNGVVAIADLQSRLTALQSRGCMQDRNVQHLVDVCALKPANETHFDLGEGEVNCLENERVRNLFFKGATNLEGAKTDLRKNCERISSTDEELNALFNSSTVGDNIRADLELEENNDCLLEHCPICYTTSKQLFDLHKIVEIPSGHLLCKDCLSNLIKNECPHCKKPLAKEIITLKNLLNTHPERVEHLFERQEIDRAELQAQNALHEAEAFGNNVEYDENSAVLESNYNQPLPNFSVIQSLFIKSEFNQPLPALPMLEYLYIERGVFNQPLPDLPMLKRLHIKGVFNQPLPALPMLEDLHIKGVFNQPLPALPMLNNLHISGLFNQSLPDLPTLEYLYIKEGVFNQPLLALPMLRDLQIKEGVFNQSLQDLPMLEYLQIDSYSFNQPIVNLINLRSLIIKTDLFNSSISNLPNLRSLEIVSNNTFNQPITNVNHLREFRIVEGGEQRRQQVHTSLAEYNIGITARARLRVRDRENDENRNPNLRRQPRQ